VLLIEELNIDRWEGVVPALGREMPNSSVEEGEMRGESAGVSAGVETLFSDSLLLPSLDIPLRLLLLDG
jgi:hypothetical protein